MIMKKCPICKTNFSDNEQRLCLKCGWDLDYYQIGLSEREEIIYDKKIRIARRNWKALISSLNKIKFLKKKVSELLNKIKSLNIDIKK